MPVFTVQLALLQGSLGECGLATSTLSDMAGNTFGEQFRITTFGESHGGGVGVVIDGCPPRLELDASDIQVELDRRRPGQSRLVTQRKEDDQVEIFNNRITNNNTANIVISSYFSANFAGQREIAAEFDPYPEQIMIYGNSFEGGGTAPGLAYLTQLRNALYGEQGKFPDIIWDGIVNPEKDSAAHRNSKMLDPGLAELLRRIENWPNVVAEPRYVAARCLNVISSSCCLNLSASLVSHSILLSSTSSGSGPSLLGPSLTSTWSRSSLMPYLQFSSFVRTFSTCFLQGKYILYSN